MAKAKIATNETIFESIYKQEHFRIDGKKIIFRDYKYTIVDCPEDLEAKLLAKKSIKLAK